MLNKSIKHHEFFIKLTDETAVVLTDPRASYLAKLRMDRGQMSTIKRLADFLVILSSLNLTLQLMFGKNPSPILKIADFISRNPSLIPKATWKEIQSSCSYPCQARKTIPKELLTFKTETVPTSAHIHANFDVLRDWRQAFAILRCNFSSYTVANIIPNEQKDTLRDAPTILALQLRIGDSIVIRLDPHSSHKSLEHGKSLEDMGIILELGHAKNPNHNGVAEKTVSELKRQILNISPEGGPIKDVTLAKALANLNKLIRYHGLSSIETWTSRSQTSCSNLAIKDEEISKNQLKMKQASCTSSAKHNDLDHTKELATIQKLLSKNPKKNLVTVQYQNLYPAEIKHPTKPENNPKSTPNPTTPRFVHLPQVFPPNPSHPKRALSVKIPRKKTSMIQRPALSCPEQTQTNTFIHPPPSLQKAQKLRKTSCISPSPHRFIQT